MNAHRGGRPDRQSRTFSLASIHSVKHVGPLAPDELAAAQAGFGGTDWKPTWLVIAALRLRAHRLGEVDRTIALGRIGARISRQTQKARRSRAFSMRHQSVTRERYLIGIPMQECAASEPPPFDETYSPWFL
jgi:hypothetical protein